MIKSIKTIMRQDREPYRVPRRVQDVIPIQCVWPDGIFKVGIKFSKTYRFTDINYKVASREDKETMFLAYSELLNGLDKYRKEYNQMLIDKATGANGITQEKLVTVTHKTANEMVDAYNFTADQRAQLAELLAEENRSMWSSALYGIGVGDGEIVVVALSQLGNVGGQPFWPWYGFNSRVEWCACFVSWCANECGYLDAGVIPRTAGCIYGSNWFKDRGFWQDNSYEPRPGDIIYFDWACFVP